jgi:hypothetical protein
MPRKSKIKSRRSKRNLRKTKNKSRRNNNQKRKYYMIGCNKKCNCSCHRHGGSFPIGGLQIKGGGCFGPLVGASYSVDKGGNYYNLPDSKAYSVDRNTQLRGGGLLPTNLVNVGREMVYGAQSVYNGLAGYKAPTDPAPYVQNKI